jgi:peptidyl-prolyl cis-trans isomerase SurA
MKRVMFLFYVCLIMVQMGIAQNSAKPLLVINDEIITVEEFLTIYNKNNLNREINQTDVEEYLELFINFRLKVAQAIELKLDTNKSFQNELAGYRQQLAQPYLSKSEVLDKLVLETFNRMKYELRVSHILFSVSRNASPSDTLAAFRKAQLIYNRLQKGESFEALALEFSDDETAKGTKQGNHQIPGNKGDLGYFTAMDLIYEFENTAYSLQLNQISKPIRTEYGYHIIKLTDKKPSLGRIQAAHILVSLPAEAEKSVKDSVQKHANYLYELIQKGESFESVAQQYSDDKGSAMRGGVLPWFVVFRMIPDFIIPLYNMEKGEVSKPILTTYGYHIIKFIDNKPIGSFDEMRNELKTKIMRDARYSLATKALVEKLKAENRYKEYPDAYNRLMNTVHDSIYKGTWNASYIKEMNDVIFKIGNREYTQQEFATFIEKNQRIGENDDKSVFIRSLYDTFVQEKMIQYESEHLEEKYPQFASLMKEYHDGILLFELTDKKVWSKAVKDTTGLEVFYKTVKHNYMWDERVEGSIFKIHDAKTAKSVANELKKQRKRNVFNPELITEKFNSDNKESVIVETGIFTKSEHPYFKDINKEGISRGMLEDGQYVVIDTREILPPAPKSIKEIRGIITNEYQNHLEREWIKELRSRYNWQVNRNVLQTLY